MTSKCDAIITGVFGAFYHIRLKDSSAESVAIKAKPRGKLRIQYEKENKGYEVLRQMLLAIGDHVEVEMPDANTNESFASIIKVLPRLNSMHRAAFSRNQCLGANLDEVFIIVSVKEPDLNWGFLERVLCESMLRKVEPAIILNKTDLLQENVSFKTEIARINYYKSLGIPIFEESFQNGVSYNLRQHIRNKRILLLGQSGVGKSTFLNAVAGKSLQTIGEISLIQKGRHTTTNPVLFRAEGECDLIDVPGLREFGMQHHKAEEISDGFPEFNAMQCRFENCSHRHEPQCGIKEAVEMKRLPEFRYKSYLSIIEGLSEQHRPRKGDFRRKENL